MHEVPAYFLSTYLSKPNLFILNFILFYLPFTLTLQTQKISDRQLESIASLEHLYGIQMINKSIIITIFIFIACLQVEAATNGQKADSVAIDIDSISQQKQLEEVEITTRKPGTTRMAGVVNAFAIGREELFKAACCNLGESFVTNPSVDVSYNDATTGARQIKLLGLSGTYVQMLTENMPNFRGAAAPYALGYVPGPWMKAIQVSKGSASVKNGYESMTGQINIEYKKTDNEQGAEINLYGNTMERIEANADANVHISKGLSTEILLHYENSQKNHDDNGDGFMDKPNVEQYHVQNRWKLKSGNYLFHGGLIAMKENRHSGQMHAATLSSNDLYNISLKTNRYEAYAKNAFILNPDNGTNIAIMTSASMHQLNAGYGFKAYKINEKNLYASLMFETNYTEMHNISLGMSLNHDYLGQRVRFENQHNAPLEQQNEQETTPGAYAQYTLNLHNRLTAMAGMRIDHSSVYGTFLTPRFHVKFIPNDILTIRLSAGKGYRTVHALAENNFLLASGRQLIIDDLKQEAAWNYGTSLALNIPLFGETLKLNAEYYYTHFTEQAVVDYDSDQNHILIGNLNGKSYSHTVQVDATYPLFKGVTMTAAWRYNDVKTTYGGILRERPLTSRYKGLLTASYKTPLGLWQIDATLQLNGGGRMPSPYTTNDGTPSWDERFHAYEQVSAQITRWFRHFSIYIGGENLTAFKQENPIIGASDPWGKDFEPTMVWGPVEGRLFYAGIRINIGRLTF